MQKIKITLRSDLCVGSGESYGNAVDSDICYSSVGLPYIPARRLKGCLRAEADRLLQYGSPVAKEETIHRLFGNKRGREGALKLGNAVLDGKEAMESWLKRAREDMNTEPMLKAAVQTGNVMDLYTYVRGQTKLKDGVAVQGSLRYTRVLKPYDPLDPEKALVFWADYSIGEEEKEKEEVLELLKQCCRALRHIGLNRNRGLGNIKVEIFEEEPDEKKEIIKNQGKRAEDDFRFPKAWLEDKGNVICLEYRIRLDQPVTLPGCGELIKEIPSRSVIGCMAREYLKNGEADQQFERLFLDGTARWSALTPVIGGKISYPTPLFLVNLKNEERYANCVCEDVKHKKQKTLDGTFSARTAQGYDVGQVYSHTVYHHTAGTNEE